MRTRTNLQNVIKSKFFKLVILFVLFAGGNLFSQVKMSEQPWVLPTYPVLFWANVAAHTNENYQVFFPPSVQFATFHAKNSFTRWPFSTEMYAGHETHWLNYLVILRAIL